MPDKSSCKLTTGDGRDPVKLVIAVEEALKVKDHDRLWAGNLLKSRILERTARGVDVHEKPFAPYSKNGPYYWYPYGKQGKKSKEIPAKSKRRAVKRFQKIIKAGTVTRTGLGLKFEHYDAFKKALGRTVVDLRGPQAPHMLQAIQVKVEGETITVGIYGEEAARASGHNDGLNKRLPQRRFFDSNPGDHKLMQEGIKNRMLERAEMALHIRGGKKAI